MSESLVIEAVRKTVTVDCVVEEAFRVFTADATSWWPVATHSINGRDVRRGRLRGARGRRGLRGDGGRREGPLGDRVVWEPPSRLVLAWNILEREAVPTEVEVRFLAEGTGTRVELEHRGWEAIAEKAAGKRDNYDNGWGQVLAAYEQRLDS